ncbi:cobalamin B12-binding domain-containing protein [Candidatus Epulonipiscium viviparus]|uniref:cobalamin B12-binding domain-containing protein n=1 Tax=Candidatus Epulonipiscium viviparus TaxID=420336 RepID=UPI0027381433|nr:corrinoid protein [Candidatus Epulopiscium viviparus]
MSIILEEISEALKKGKAKTVKEKVQQAIDEGIPPKTILDDAMLKSMGEIGVKFKANEIFVPEVLVAARALNAGLVILEPLLAAQGIEPIGTAVIGTVRGDLHDIGKNLVAMMLRGAGLEVIDAGVDVSTDKFLELAEQNNAQIICMSSLLTTTMEATGEIIKEMEDRGVRNKYKIMIGGAPVTAEFAKKVNADYYTPDAATAAEVAKEIVSSH